MIYLHYKDTKTFGHSFSFLLIFNALSANYLQVGNFSKLICETSDTGRTCVVPTESALVLPMMILFSEYDDKKQREANNRRIILIILFFIYESSVGNMFSA